MKYISTLVLTLSFAFFVNANPELDRIKLSDPEAYSQAKADCEGWAETDLADGGDRSSYMEKCISEAIGYLADTSEQEYGYEEPEETVAE